MAYDERARSEPATVHDLRLFESELKNETRLVGSRLKTEIYKLENRLTLHMGAMAIFIIGAAGAMKFFA